MIYLLFVIAALCVVAAVLSLLAWRSASRPGQGGPSDPALGAGLVGMRQLLESLGGSLREEHERLRSSQADSIGTFRTSQAGELTTLRQEVQAQIAGFQEQLRREVKESFAEFQTTTSAGGLELRTSLTERVGELSQRSEEARTQQAGDLRTAAEDTKKELVGFRDELARQLAEFRQDLATTTTQLREESTQSRDKSEKASVATADTLAASQRAALAAMETTMGERLGELTRQNDTSRRELADSQKSARAELQTSIKDLSAANERKLDEMRATVQEKLDATLGERLDASFKQVSSQLENVHKGLGEMQNLAQGVGSLQRTLTNVKTRGTWAELQLEALLSDVLTTGQYERQWRVNPDSNELADCAIRLPGGEDGIPVWLAIDSKFPSGPYEQLLAEYDAGDPDLIKSATKALIDAVRREAASIDSKYVKVPYTTDFAVMYLPTEGLFAEVVRQPGLIQKLRNEHRIVVAGPTTLTALLSSMSMGFRTLAIQERSSEVWKVLGQVKTQFEKSGEVWAKLEKQLGTAQKTARDAGTRHRAISSKLDAVETAPLESDFLDAITGPVVEAESILEEWAEGESDEFVREPGALIPPPAYDSSEVRQWARDNGIPVGDRGRLGDDIVQAYLDARAVAVSD